MVGEGMKVAVQALLSSRAARKSSLHDMKGEVGSLLQEAASDLAGMHRARVDRARALGVQLRSQARQQRAQMKQVWSEQRKGRLKESSRLRQGLEHQVRNLKEQVCNLKEAVARNRAEMQADLSQARAEWGKTAPAPEAAPVEEETLRTTEKKRKVRREKGALS